MNETFSWFYLIKLKINGDGKDVRPDWKMSGLRLFCDNCFIKNQNE